MGVVTIKEPKKGDIFEYYMDNKLKGQLDNRVKKIITTKDEDYVLIIDGSERSGKSTFAKQLAAYVDPSIVYDMDRVCFTPEEFRQAILKAEKGQAVIFDEAYRGLSAKGALTEVNKILVSLMMEMGQKNLFVVIVMPTFYLLEKYVAIWRARGLFHVFRNKKNKKGFWVFFNERKKKILYLRGKKDYNYLVKGVKSGFKGKFNGKYIGNEDAYRNKKRKSLVSGYKQTKNEKFKAHRDRLLYVLYKELSMERQIQLKDLVELCKIYKIPLKMTQISDILKIEKNRQDNP